MNYVSFSSLNVNNLTIEGLFSLNKSTIEIAKPVTTEIGPIAAAALSHVEQAHSELGANMNQSQKSALTGDIQELDKQRDADLREIFNVNKTYLKSSDAAKKAASSTLQLFLTPYKGAAKQPINIETGTLSEMIGKYKASAELKAAAATLGIDGLFTSLETKNNALNEIYLSRNAEYADRSDAATDAKPTAISAYMKFCTAIEQAHHYTPSETLTAVFNKMDELRKKYHALEGKKVENVSGDAAGNN